ncbi:chitin synthase-domain-containing protein [Spinellus fusiger]|nr:chitin synthase-domain-containing protein [Spinellus fusiger]
MRRRGKDQAIVLSGVSGSGKSTTHRHILNELLLLSTHTRREDKVRQQIVSVNTIVDAFTTAATTDNIVASRIGKFHSLQFNERGRIVGSHLAVYLLDKFRVTRQQTAANYHVFHQLLTGTSTDEKVAFHIHHTADHFAYLKHTFGTAMARDEFAFGDLKAALKTCGFKTKTVAHMCQLLAAILHLGNVQFVDANKHHFGGGTSSSFSSQESCRVKNKDTLSLVAAALGVATAKLENTLTHKLKLIGKEFCTAFLTVETATEQRDSLARALYTVLVLWIVDSLNQKLSASNYTSNISILDPMGIRTTHPTACSLHDLCLTFAEERIHQYLLERTFDPTSIPNQARHDDGLVLPPVMPDSFFDSSLPFFLGTHANKYALVPLMNHESQRFQAYALDATDSHMLSTLFQKKKASANKPDKENDYHALRQPSTPSYSFAIQHFGSHVVDYSVDGFLESNLDALSPDFIHLFRYSCTNTFVHDLFASAVLSTEVHPRDERTIIKAQLPTQPKDGQWIVSRTLTPTSAPTSITTSTSTPAPSNEPIKESTSEPIMATVLDQVVNSMENLTQVLSTMRLFEVLHIRPNNQQLSDYFDPTIVQDQLRTLKILAYGKHSVHYDTLYSYSFTDFLNRYRHLIHAFPFDERQEDDRDTVVRLINMMHWTNQQVQIGHRHIWLSFDIWRDLENHLRALEKEARIPAVEAATERWSNEHHKHDNPFEDDARSDLYSSNDFYDDRTDSEEYPDGEHGNKGAESQWGEEEDNRGLADGYGPNMDMSKMVEDYRVQPEEQVEEVPITSVRRYWSRFVWVSTWWIPSCVLRWIGRMNRQDVQMAWREKFTLCLLIFLFSASIIFFIVGFGEVICQGTKEIYSAADVTNHQTINNYWVSIHGKVYDLTKFVASDHGSSSYVGGKINMEPLAGRDLSHTFPPPLTIACVGLVMDDSVIITPNETIVLGAFVHYSSAQQPDKTLERLRDPNWMTKYFNPLINQYKKGDLVIPMKQIKNDFSSWGRLIAVMDEKVYDITDYMATAHQYPIDSPGVPNYHYLDSSVELLFKKYGGGDITEQWRKATASMKDSTRAQHQACLDNVFYVGRLDYRDSLRCIFVNYLLLSFAVVMSLVILVKFLAALQFGGAPTPEEHDKFVICQVPCYTEDEESLRKTINSLTAMTYDDKRKLMFLIADGMIIGGGNDKPTPQILLGILGHNMDGPDVEPLMFKSIGEGSKQLNYGKVYSGLYENEGHVVPYIVVVKVGKATERTKPGNRGKRDSQIICMNFLNKVHFDSEMTPLELEIYYHIKHIIGVDPSLYEYILMVDSDTEVYSDALNRMIACMLHDSRIIGLCGETELGNEDRSWTTMIQVYEYYISHHLVKAFESLFGSVTCLPGCFCMYRIRTANKRQPLIVAPNVIHGYSDNQVDTLHKKNLLHLGEDRYLTTLMMKNFPQYKMMFTPYAKCRTVAPDEWYVLLSQRRRWINSTIHNLLELILLQELCGFCCFSMRFVVMIDLIGTITLPSSVIYLAYLIYIATSKTGPIPVIALGMLAGVYGLQALIFIIKRQWQHIGWMVIYIAAIPIFSFFIPLYSFWHFDDFSWGNTRVVVGDKTKQIIVTDDEKFDERMIPLKTWAVYEQELWESKSVVSEETKATVCSYESQETQTTTTRSRKKSDFISQETDSVVSRRSGSVRSGVSAQDRPPFLPPLITGLSEQRLSEFSVDLSAVLNSATHGKKRRGDEEGEGKTVILPEDEDMEREIHRILATANLMTLTKKQVRDQLSSLFGVDLTIKKGFINATIERILENDV